MNRWTSAAVLYVLGVVALGGCSNKEADPQAIPVPTTTAATVAADPTTTPPPAAGGDADGGADAASAAAPTTGTPPPSQGAAGDPTPTPAAKPAGASIDACCSALSAIGSSGKGALAKSQAASAAAVCPGIAKRVKSGETSRAAGLAQIRSSFVGSSVPPECK